MVFKILLFAHIPNQIINDIRKEPFRTDLYLCQNGGRRKDIGSVNKYGFLRDNYFSAQLQL